MLVVVLSTIAVQQQGILDTQLPSPQIVFTVVAILSMVTHPANMIFTILPKAISARTSANRIEQYLNEHERSFERRTKTQGKPSEDEISMDLRLQNASFSFAPDQANVLHNISLVLSPGVTLCIGKVGHGKTTLVRAILGELMPLVGIAGSYSGPIGYVSQSAWLPSSTIQEAIVGPYTTNILYDPEWYERVIKLCCLGIDISSMPAGHNTVTGSNGSNLSGGQRQRIVSVLGS